MTKSLLALQSKIPILVVGILLWYNKAVDEIQERDDVRAIFARAFDVLEQREAVVAIITSPNKSVGQIMELGAALSQGKPIYLFEHSSAEGSTYLPRLVTKTYEWTTELELLDSLKKIDAFDHQTLPTTDQ